MPGSPRYEDIAWESIKEEVARKINFLQASWLSTQTELIPEFQEKLVADIYGPSLRLLAEFCSCVREDETKE